MADYRYLLADALTGQLLEELPLNCQSYSQQINGVGSCTGTLPIADPTMPALWKQATEVKRSLLMVLRDDNPNPVWGGMVMKRRPANDSTVAEVGAETLEGYWQRRRLKTDLTYGSATDLFDIVRGIITQLQGVTGGNMRMLVTSNMHGSTTTVTYLGKDRTKGLDAVNKLAEVSSFEYTITWARSGSVFTPTMTLAAPALATNLDAVLLEFPGSLVAPVDVPEDGGDAPNAVTGVGADSAGTPLLAESIDTTGELAAGYPIFEDEVQMKDETVFASLAARTATELAAKLADHAVPTVDLSPPVRDTDLHLGDLTLGQATRLRCTCPFHPAGINGIPGLDISDRRITGWTVNPGSAEKVQLALASTTGKITLPKRRRDVAYYLADLDRRVRQLATRT